jgi:hypothetical protein
LIFRGKNSSEKDFLHGFPVEKSFLLHKNEFLNVLQIVYECRRRGSSRKASDRISAENFGAKIDVRRKLCTFQDKVGNFSELLGTFKILVVLYKCTFQDQVENF